MKTTKELYTNASVVICGAVCAVLSLHSLLWCLSSMERHLMIPGLSQMCGLCMPILYFWVGMLLRPLKENPMWWIQLIVACVAAVSFYYYRHIAESRNYVGALYLAMAGLGYLTPTRVLISSSHNKGWISLAMVALSAFCYTAITVVKNRLLWGPIIPGHPDMELMMETVLVNAEPLMVIVTTYFVAQFTFSEIAQWLGSKSWFRWMSVILAIYVFINSFNWIFNYQFIGSSYCSYLTPFIWIIAQPITVYIVVTITRFMNDLRKERSDRRSWKDLIRL